MKTLEELVKIREKALAQAEGRSAEEQHIRYTVTIGMATCGITAGARPVFTALLECVANENDEGIRILQTGCFGKCQEEPMLKLEDEKGCIYYYGHLTPERIEALYEQHMKRGNPVTAYLVEMES